MEVSEAGKGAEGAVGIETSLGEESESVGGDTVVVVDAGVVVVEADVGAAVEAVETARVEACTVGEVDGAMTGVGTAPGSVAAGDVVGYTVDATGIVDDAVVVVVDESLGDAKEEEEEQEEGISVELVQDIAREDARSLEFVHEDEAVAAEGGAESETEAKMGEGVAEVALGAVEVRGATSTVVAITGFRAVSTAVAVAGVRAASAAVAAIRVGAEVVGTATVESGETTWVVGGGPAGGLKAETWSEVDVVQAFVAGSGVVVVVVVTEMSSWMTAAAAVSRGVCAIKLLEFGVAEDAAAEAVVRELAVESSLKVVEVCTGGGGGGGGGGA